MCAPLINHDFEIKRMCVCLKLRKSNNFANTYVFRAHGIWIVNRLWVCEQLRPIWKSQPELIVSLLINCLGFSLNFVSPVGHSTAQMGSNSKSGACLAAGKMHSFTVRTFVPMAVNVTASQYRFVFLDIRKQSFFFCSFCFWLRSWHRDKSDPKTSYRRKILFL